MTDSPSSTAKHIKLDIVCTACDGTGLYVGMGERNGAAVVCYRCKGPGRQEYIYEPFVARKPSPESVTTVHVGRGYLLGNAPEEGGLPIGEWSPGASVPADRAYYCPFVFTSQGWCAKPEQADPFDRPRAPLLAGAHIDSCKHWKNKAECWSLFDEHAPESVRRQLS